MADHPRLMSKAEVGRVLHRVGLSAEQVDAVLADLDDPVDLDRDLHVLESHGLSRGKLMDMMGGSP